MRLPVAVVLLLAMLAPVVVADSHSHPFSVHDMLAMSRISDPQVSPGGRWIVFTVRETDLDANKGRTDVWRARIGGSELRRFTSDPASDHHARWSPDGETIWFLSTRSGSSQVWSMAADGGEAVQRTDEPLDVTSLAVSPDGRSITYSMDVFVDCDTIACTKGRLDAVAESKHDALVYDQLLYRHWDTWKDGRRSHLFVKKIDDGDAIDIMGDMDADCPSKPFGGAEEYTYTPDGKGIVFSARDAGRKEAWSTDFDLYLAPVDASEAPRNLTEDNPAWDTQPVFSPDGKTLAYLAMKRAGYESDRRRIVLRGWPDGDTRVLTEDWDRSPYSIAWSFDGTRLLANANDLGRRPLFSVDPKTADIKLLDGEGSVKSIATGRGRIVYALDHLRSPVELYSIELDGSNRRPVTQINAERVAAARMGEPEQFTFKGWNNETVHAWVVKPVDFDPAKKYPVAFLIHGGPQGSFGSSFHYRWNPQAYAGAGYAAVMVDFHGSTGYGQAFTDSIGGDWGGKPLEDLQKGLAAALARYEFMDGERVVGLGASYGGYMINWIAGNWPDRFRCLVNHDGNLDSRHAYFATEELWFPEWDRRGTPWTNPKGYEEHNPVNFVDRWKTPMLVIHGALDYRVVDTQGMATFTALQRRGVPSKFVYFPTENHWILKPHNSVFWHETVIDWLDQWTRED